MRRKSGWAVRLLAIGLKSLVYSRHYRSLLSRQWGRLGRMPWLAGLVLVEVKSDIGFQWPCTFWSLLLSGQIWINIILESTQAKQETHVNSLGLLIIPLNLGRPTSLWASGSNLWNVHYRGFAKCLVSTEWPFCDRCYILNAESMPFKGVQTSR